MPRLPDALNRHGRTATFRALNSVTLSAFVHSATRPAARRAWSVTVNSTLSLVGIAIAHEFVSGLPACNPHHIASGGMTSHCAKGDRPMPIHGMMGIIPP